MKLSQRLVLVVSILASVVAAIDGFIVNVALPTISRELGGGLVTQQWTVDAYMVTLGALILVAGSLSDVFGRKRVLFWGLIWFGITSLLCAIAPTAFFLIIARALQGVAGALLVPSSLAIIISTFKGREQSRAIGIWTAWFSIATIIGPLAGGLILAAMSWRWIFAVNVVPIALTVALLMRLNISENIQTRVNIDIIGAILCVLGIGLPVFALIEQPKYGWSNTLILVPLIIGVLLIISFIWYERRTKEPMLNLALFSVRNFSVGNVATLAIYAGLGASSFVMSIALQQVGGYSPLQASFATIPVSILVFLLSSRFGAVAGRFGPRLFMTLGPVTAAFGFLLMLRVQSQIQYLSDLFPGILLFGIGLSMTVAPLTTAILSNVESSYAGIASAVNNAVARVAGLLAVALIGVVTGPHITIEGFHRALVVIASLMFIGGIVSFVGIRTVQDSTQ